MNKSIFARVRSWLQPTLDGHGATGSLSTPEVDCLYALFQLVVDDERVPREICETWLDRSARTEPGHLTEYRRGVELLQATSRRSFAGRSFAELTLDERDGVLRRVLRPFRHKEAEPRWRRRLRFTQTNLDTLLTPPERRRFRDFVVRDLLRAYYTRAEGWAVVGYDEFPGHVRKEREPCQITAVDLEGDELVLTLSDATFETLEPRRLELDDVHGLAVFCKSGRQRAVFERSAYEALVEHIEPAEDGDGWFLRIGNARHRILAQRA